MSFYIYISTYKSPAAGIGTTVAFTDSLLGTDLQGEGSGDADGAKKRE